MLITAMSLTDLFEVTKYGSPLMSLGMWSVCGYDDYYSYSCESYNGEWNSDSDSAMFNAMRSLTVVSIAFTLLTGILGAIRLARIQRNKPNSNRLSNSTLFSALLALASAGTSFGLTFPLNASLSDAVGEQSGDYGFGSSWGVSWVMLIVGVGMLVVGVTVHMIAHCCYQYNVASGSDDELNEQPGLYAANGYAAAPSVFSHPQPLHQHSVLPVPAVYYPTAAAVHYPPPQYVYHQ